MKEGWVYKKLGEVAQSDLGKTLNSSKDKGTLYPYLCAVNVLWDNIDTTTLKETRFEESELERYSVKKGDLLICEGGDIGRAAIWDKEESIQYQNALHRVRFNGEVFPRFCLLYFRCLKGKGVLDARYGKGVTIKHLVKSTLLSIPIPVPPLSEQQRIVSELDLLSSIIEKKKAQLKEYDQLAQSIFYDMFGDPVSNEKGWEVKKLVDCCKNCDSQRKPITAKDRIKGTIPYYGASGVVDFVKDYIFDGEFLLISEDGANLIIRSTPIAFRIKGKTWVNNHAHVLQFDALFKQIFMEYSINLRDISSIVTGCAQPKLTQAAMNNINIPYPPLSLQQSFASKIEGIERQKALVQQSITEVETLFNSRMDFWFS